MDIGCFWSEAIHGRTEQTSEYDHMIRLLELL